jgi:hypothetical protein
MLAMVIREKALAMPELNRSRRIVANRYLIACYVADNNSLHPRLGDNLPRLIWMPFANPDTSTSYVEVAFLGAAVAILPRISSPLKKECHWLCQCPGMLEISALAKPVAPENHFSTVLGS